MNSQQSGLPAAQCRAEIRKHSRRALFVIQQCPQLLEEALEIRRLDQYTSGALLCLLWADRSQLTGIDCLCLRHYHPASQLCALATGLGVEKSWPGVTLQMHVRAHHKQTCSASKSGVQHIQLP